MTTSEESQTTLIAPGHKAMVALCAVGTILLLGWLLMYSIYGIDFTDESFYLVWIANPFQYDGSLTQFGFVYHPLYKLLSGDIATLRQANILITFGLAWSLTYFFLNSLAPVLKENQITLLTISAGFATSALILFHSWQPTPSYNSLALQSLLISSIGLVLADKTVHLKSIIGWMLIGVGGWLTFMAKPSTALALVVCVSIYLLFARKYSIRMLALAATLALALLLLSALMIDGSILGFINRLQLGIEFSKQLGGGNALGQILRIDDFQLSAKFKIIFLLVFGALFVALWSMYAKNKKWLFIGLLISSGFFVITGLLALGYIHQAAGLGQFEGLLIFVVFYAAMAVVLALGRLKALKTISAEQWTIAFLFLAMPHIYAFGTGNNYWEAGSGAAIFWLLAGLTLLGSLTRERASWLLALPLALATQAITATLLQTGLEQPYRQSQPLRLNTSNLEIGSQMSALMLSEGYSAYIAAAMATAKKAGFEPNTPLIDLSGQSPGILYAIGAENIGLAWIIGGYPGSLKLAETALTRTSCEKISEGWILFEHDGPRSIPTELLLRLGADFPSSYERVGTWQIAKGAGGYPDRRTQDLYKPVEQDKTLMNCHNLRKRIDQ